MVTKEKVIAGGDLTITNISKTYETRGGEIEALSSISLDVQPGQFISLLGPSGCGKSTLLMIVAGLRDASGGEVIIGDRKVTKPQTECGIVFQSPLLLDWRDAIGNVMLQVEARPISNRRAHREQCMDLLRSVGLEGFEKKYPRELSGGMQQRVAICRALIHNPPLLLMDEPFGALDALTREQMIADLHKLWFENRKTVLFVTHSISEAVFLSDRVVMMTPRPGKVDRIVDIDIPHPRRLDVQTTARFGEYVGEITKIFQTWGVLRED